MPEVIAGLEIPETAAVAEATRLIQETTGPLIYPETTNGTVNSHVLEHFIPGFQRTTTVETSSPASSARRRSSAWWARPGRADWTSHKATR
jgi:hypothetical protein